MIDAVLPHFRINRLSEAGFLETNYLGRLDSEMFFEVGRVVMLHDWIMRKSGEDLSPAFFRDVGRDKNEMEPASAAAQSLTSDDEIP